jgi:hypothetical protein
MHRIHGGFTAAFPIKEDEGEFRSLSNLLILLNKNVPPYTTNFEVADTTLFVSGVVLPGQEELPPTFVLATTYCGPLKTHLYDLIAKNKKTLCKLLMFCKEFNGGYYASDEEIYMFLEKHSYYSNFNSRCNFISKQDTKNEKELRKEIEEYLDKAQKSGAFKNRSAKEVQKLIQRHILTSCKKFDWALEPFKKNFREVLETLRLQLTSKFLRLLKLAIIVPPFLSLLVLFWPILPLKLCLLASIPIVFILLVMLSFQFINCPTAEKPSDDRLRELAATQLNPVLNEMTAAAPLKPGILRPLFYASALRILGSIAPIRLKIPTVSNIRWLVIDNKKRLLFLSCFSNTTDFYVRDFIVGNTARGLNFMFSHGEGFPRAFFSYFKGILKNPEGFMHAVHTGQQVTQLWYAHEKHLTADVITKNRKIRNGLFKKMTEEEAREWLKLL